MDKKIEIIRSFKYTGKDCNLSFSITPTQSESFKELLEEAVKDVTVFIEENKK